MMKQMSFLIPLASVALCSCQTMKFGEVAPELQGSAMGELKLGKEGKDFFVIPGEPITPAQMRGDFPVPPQNIVVFKTRERQPMYRVARAVGAPARGISRVYSFLVDSVVKVAFGWWPKKKAEPTTTPQISYPAPMLPKAEPFAQSRLLGTTTGPRAAAHGQTNPQTHRIGG